MKYLLVIVMFVSLNATSIKQNIRTLNHLTKQQKDVLFKTFKKAKPYDLSYTMVAILWQESFFGKYKINLQDPSCGYFHKLLPEYAKELNLKPNNWNQSRICQSLLNFNTSFDVALSTLQTKYNYCKITYNSNYEPLLWKCMVTRYNGSGKQAKKYYKEITKKIRALNIWMKSHRKLVYKH
jgi:hypothetical protein